jgi:hypothetical protein
MSWHWTVHSLPELKHLPWSERSRLVRKYWREPFRNRWVLALCGVLGAVMFVLPVATILLFPALYRHPAAMAFFILFSPACVFVLNLLTIPLLRPHFRAEVGGLCLHCGYDIRATPDECPECGTPVPFQPATSHD